MRKINKKIVGMLSGILIVLLVLQPMVTADISTEEDESTEEYLFWPAELLSYYQQMGEFLELICQFFLSATPEEAALYRQLILQKLETFKYGLMVYESITEMLEDGDSESFINHLIVILEAFKALCPLQGIDEMIDTYIQALRGKLDDIEDFEEKFEQRRQEWLLPEEDEEDEEEQPSITPTDRKQKKHIPPVPMPTEPGKPGEPIEPIETPSPGPVPMPQGYPDL